LRRITLSRPSYSALQDRDQGEARVRTLLVLDRLLLAAVFVTAGVAKLVDQATFRRAVRQFGVPRFASGPISLAMPVVEIALAAALLPATSARWGAAGALALLSMFSAAIVYNLARGRTPDCRCFGQLHSSPIGWSTLARNGGLAGLAALVVWAGGAAAGGSITDWASGITAGQMALVLGAALVMVVGLESWVLLNLLRQHGRLLLRVEALEPATAPKTKKAHQPVRGLPVGTEAPAFELPDLDGQMTSSEALRAAGTPVMLIFTDEACGPCSALMPDIARWQRDQADKVTVVVVGRGDVAANRAKAAEHGVTGVLLQKKYEVADAYRFAGTPSAVVVAPNGRIATPLVVGAEAIRNLAADTIRGPQPVPVQLGRHQAHGHGHGAAEARNGPTIGSEAPDFTLPDLTGQTVALADLAGSDTLVVFWNPGCGFCQRMVPQIKAWETDASQAGNVRLVLISTGSAEANRALGLECPILLDSNSETMRRYGANGTPMGVLIGADGRVASELAVGAPALMDLLGRDAAKPAGRVDSPH
jgi:peroxiredoxin